MENKAHSMPLLGVYSESLPVVDLTVFGLQGRVGVITKYTANYIMGILYLYAPATVNSFGNFLMQFGKSNAVFRGEYPLARSPIFDVELGKRDNIVIINNDVNIGDTVWLQYAY